MPSGVGAPRRRAARAVAGITLIVLGLAAPTLPAGAQAEPSGGIIIEKVEIGGIAPATFDVTGPGITGTRNLVANVEAVGTPTPAVPALPPLTPGVYVITETAPADENGQSVWELTNIDCGGAGFVRNGNSIELTVTDAVITCTFTNTVTRGSILGLKIATGGTSSWVRPAQFHITCSGPNFELDIDIEPPVGPGGPGTYVIGQGSLPPGTCTISETDTGSDFPPTVTMVVTNHGLPIAVGNLSVTFTAHAGDDLVLRVTNAFLASGPPAQEPGTTTTIAGGTTTTTATTTTTTATTVPGGGTTTVPGGGATTVPGGGAGATQAPATTTPQLPVTGSLDGRPDRVRPRRDGRRGRARCTDPTVRRLTGAEMIGVAVRRPGARSTDCRAKRVGADRSAAESGDESDFRGRAGRTARPPSASRGTRTCSVVSRSRIVTARSSSDSKSTVTASGVPISS